MNLIKKFKDYILNKTIKSSPDYFDSVYYIDVDEIQNICQDLFDIGFNPNIGKPILHINKRWLNTKSRILNLHQMPDIADQYINNPVKVPLPVFKDGMLFSLQFSRPKNDQKLSTDFYDIVEEVIDRMESTFPIELYDEDAQSNRVVRSNGELYWKFNPDGMQYGGMTRLSSISYCDYFILAFRLKNEHS